MTAPITSRREWTALGVLALPTLLVSMDVTLLLLAVPALSADLRPSPTELLWIVDAYGLLIAAFLIPMGMLGDRIGRRRLLMIGSGAFAVASVLAAFAPTAGALIAARALLGVAGATLMPSTLSLISTLFTEPAQRTFAMGVWVASLSVGTVIGPIVGGALLEVAWWGSVFLLAVPVMGALLVLGPRVLPEVRDPAPGRIDPVSVALALVGTLAFAGAVKKLAADGLEPAVLAALAGALVAAPLFVARQRRLADPLVDVRLFRVPAFAAALLANTIGMGALVGIFLLVTQHLQVALGLSPLEAGVALLPYAAAVLVASMAAAALSARLGARAVVGGGLLVLAAGIVLLTQVEADGGLALPIVATIVMAAGGAPVLALATDLVVAAAPPERAGSAAAVSETGTELGAALGLAVLGGIATAIAGTTAVEGAAGALADGLSGAAVAAAGVLVVAALVVLVLMPPRALPVPETA